MATILEKEELGSITNFVVDDGSGRIIVRFFERSFVVQKLNIGETVNVIGKVRTYNAEKYLSPEIMKNIEPLWLKVRSFELQQRPAPIFLDTPKIEEKREEIAEDDEVVLEETVLPAQKIMSLIKKLDRGEGVFIEQLIKDAPFPNAETIIEKMLEHGDIFQISAGKVKLL